MTLSESLEAKARREVAGKRCFCGSMKRRGEPFCPGCYRRLPFPLARKMHKTFSEDFASDYDEAKDWLHAHL